MARPSHVPNAETRKHVQTYKALGVRDEEIARLIGVHPQTMRKHYRDELDLGHIRANAKVAQRLFEVATAPKTSKESVTAMIFWLKTQARWTEQNKTLHADADGGKLQEPVMIYELPDNGRGDQTKPIKKSA